MFTNLTTGRALPLVVVSVLAGAAVLILLVLDKIRLIRPLAVIAVVAVAAGWAIAQYPYLLPPRLTIAGAAAPGATEATELVVVVIIAVLVAPSFVLLFRLAQRGQLGESEAIPASTPPPSCAAAGTAGMLSPWDKRDTGAMAGTGGRGGMGATGRTGRTGGSASTEPSRHPWPAAMVAGATVAGATVVGAALAARAVRRVRGRLRRSSR